MSKIYTNTYLFSYFYNFNIRTDPHLPDDDDIGVSKHFGITKNKQVSVNTLWIFLVKNNRKIPERRSFWKNEF
jgi:hypothetical protein